MVVRCLSFVNVWGKKTFSGHVIKTFRVLTPGLETCQHKCFMEANCVSYNLGPIKGQIRSCELSDADHVTDPGDVVAKEGFEYCPIKVTIFLK
jgi:hypothetical protein